MGISGTLIRQLANRFKGQSREVFHLAFISCSPWSYIQVFQKEKTISFGRRFNNIELMGIRLDYPFNLARTLSINSSSVSAATGRLLTNANVFLRPGPQYD